MNSLQQPALARLLRELSASSSTHTHTRQREDVGEEFSGSKREEEDDDEEEEEKKTSHIKFSEGKMKINTCQPYVLCIHLRLNFCQFVSFLSQFFSSASSSSSFLPVFLLSCVWMCMCVCVQMSFWLSLCHSKRFYFRFWKALNDMNLFRTECSAEKKFSISFKRICCWLWQFVSLLCQSETLTFSSTLLPFWLWQSFCVACLNAKSTPTPQI